MFISIAITMIAFFATMYLIGKMYCEFNSRIEKLEREGKEDE